MKKSYVVRYYIDYKHHGIDVIFNDKEVAEEHAKMMTEQDDDINCRYSVYEEIVYNPFDERRSVGMKTLTDINKWYVDQTQAQLILLAREEIWNNRFVKNIKDIDKQYYKLKDHLTK